MLRSRRPLSLTGDASSVVSIHCVSHHLIKCVVSKYLFLISCVFILAPSILGKIIKELKSKDQLKMKYLKLLMAPQLTDLIIPYNVTGPQEASPLLLTSTQCPVKTNFFKS